MPIQTLEDFISEYTNIVNSNKWIPTHRNGPTGIGKTLEDLLGIPENNFNAPDFGEYELKSSRINSNSMLTLFTCSSKPSHSNSYLREKYGYSSGAYDNTEKVLHATLCANRFTQIGSTGHSLKVTSCETGIYIESEDGLENVYWPRQLLKTKFERKYRNKFVYAKAEVRNNNGTEEFRYTEAYEVSGFDFNLFLRLLEQGKIYVDLRIGQYHKGRLAGRTHDHGTGLRIKENDHPLLFVINRRIV